MKLSVKAENTNYAAEIFRLPKPCKHPNADKLSLINFKGNVIITGMNSREGDLYVYFPLETAINKEYLSWSNSFSHPELNANTKVQGFFNDAGRVRAVKLRSQPSMGYIVPLTDLILWLDAKKIKCSVEDFTVGTEFDYIDEKIVLCEKYVNIEALRKLDSLTRNNSKKGKVKRTSKLVDDQFRFHIDTEPLKKNIHLIKPEDNITVSYKIHGSSAVYAHILVKRKLSTLDKIARWFGVKVEETKYDYVYSSRKVVKNEYEVEEKQNLHYYDSNIWSLTGKIVNDSIKPGITLYGELVGQTPSGKWIQKNYDYGTLPNQQEFYVYRISITNAKGDVFEFTTEQVISYCSMHGLKMVPIFYRGKAKDLFPELSITEHWNQNFLDALLKKYTEKDCYMCTNKVPEEGIVVAKDGVTFTPFKLKSFRFLEAESVQLDSGEIDMESAESVAPVADPEPAK